MEKFKETYKKNLQLTPLVAAIKKAEEQFPHGILLKPLKPNKSVSEYDYTRLFESLFSRQSIDKDEFKHLFKERTTRRRKEKKFYFFRPTPAGFHVPLPKERHPHQYVDVFNSMIKELNLKIVAEQSTHHVCSDGSNVEVELIYPVPGTTTKQVKTILADLGVVEDLTQTEQGYRVSFSKLEHTLLEAQIMFGEGKNRWTPILPASAIKFRFVSRRTCGCCGEVGHHPSRCPTGFKFKAEILRQLFPKPIRSRPAREKQKQKDTQKQVTVDSVKKKDSNDLELNVSDSGSVSMNESTTFDSSFTAPSPDRKRTKLNDTSEPSPMFLVATKDNSDVSKQEITAQKSTLELENEGTISQGTGATEPSGGPVGVPIYESAETTKQDISKKNTFGGLKTGFFNK